MVDAAFFDPKSPQFIDDPYPIYKALRQHDPIHRSAHGFWVLTRYEDVVSALREPNLSNEPSRFAVVNQRNKGKYVAVDVADNIIPFMDPPRHTQSRRLIAQAFRARLEEFTMEIDIQGLSENIIDEFRSIGAIDLINQFGTPLSLAVICRFVGFPEQDGCSLKSWSDGFFYLFNPIPSADVLDRVNRDLAEFREYVRLLVEDRRIRRRDDLISRLIEAGDEQTTLSTAEIVDTCMLIFADGVENVDSGIGNCMLALLEHEADMASLEEQPELLGSAIEECLRLNPPAQFLARIARDSFDFNGAPIKKDQTVLLVLAAANHDPDIFPYPEKLDIRRDNIRHLAFGRGRHSCLGGSLVALEYQAAIRVILSRLRDLKLEDSKRQWIARRGHRWLDGLRVSFSPY